MNLLCRGYNYFYTSIYYTTGVNIDMTAPVILNVKEEIPFLEKSVYKLSFLLPSAYQTQAPQPTDSTVSVRGRKKFNS